MKKKLFSHILLLLAAVLLTACSVLPKAGAEGRDVFVEESPQIGAPSFESGGEFVAQPDVASGALPANDAIAAQVAERLVIKNADLSVVVDDPEQTMDAIASHAERLGGFVVSSNLFQNTLATGVEVPGAYITIRVPDDSFQETLDFIRQQVNDPDDVLTDNQSGQDVTAEYTDLQSRLRNLEGAEKLLRQIMDEARDTEDILNAFNQLNMITEQIEVLKGQIKYYEESAALSAISVELISNEAVQPIKIGPWEPVGVAKHAIEALIKALQGILEAVIWLALYVLPIVLVIAVPLWLVGRGLRGWLARRKNASPRRRK